MAEFVALAARLRAPVAPPPALPPAVPPSTDDAERAATLRAAIRDARLFRARLGDAFDAERGRLLRALATEVLGRELRIAPCALDAIARRLAAATPSAVLHVAPADAAVDAGLPVVVDPSLRAGDAIVAVEGGALDARLGVRLAAVLEAAS